jgi:hypothetical protein
MSLIEAITNVAVGLGVALLTRILVFPLYGLQAKTSQSAGCSPLHRSPGRTPCAGFLRRSERTAPKRIPPGTEPGGIGHSEPVGGLPLGFVKQRSLGNAVGAMAALGLLRGDAQPKLLLQRAADRTAAGMAPPAGGFHDLLDGRTLVAAEHGDHQRLLAAGSGAGPGP